MDSANLNYVRKLLWMGAGGVGVFPILLLVMPVKPALGLCAGFLLSYLFVASNFVVVKRLDISDHSKFLKLFFAALIVRFVLVLAAFVALLSLANIDQILFTVSFIISYICLSIIEIIFINKILENRHAK